VVNGGRGSNPALPGCADWEQGQRCAALTAFSSHTAPVATTSGDNAATRRQGLLCCVALLEVLLQSGAARMAHGGG